MVEKKKFKDALFDGLKSAVVSTVASMGANTIGDLKPDIGTGASLLLHGGLGAGIGYGLDGERGAVTGFGAGILAEGTAELAEQVGSLSPETNAMIGNALGTTVGLATGNVSTAFTVSDNATRHNYSAHFDEVTKHFGAELGPINQVSGGGGSSIRGANRTATVVRKGVNNPETKKALDYGNQKHKDFTEQNKDRHQGPIGAKNTRKYGEMREP